MTQFRGFTDIFKRINEEDEKGGREVEQLTCEKQVSDLIAEENDESRPKNQPLDNVRNPFIPQLNYHDWVQNRLRTVVLKCREKYGTLKHNNVDNEAADLTYKVEQYCRSIQDSTVHDAGINSLQHRPGDDSNIEGKPISQFPQRYQIELVNDRLRKLLTKNDIGLSYKDVLHYEKPQMPPREIVYDKMAAQRKRLTEYMRRTLNLEADFQPESFQDWYAKFSFTLDKKLKKLPKVPTNSEEDFYSWLDRVKEILEHRDDQAEHLDHSENKFYCKV